MDIIETKIKEIVDLGYFEDEYVYDITMEDTNYPHFFANDILVHNSCYFLTNTDNIEDAVEVADCVAEYVNMSFQQFAIDGFLCSPGFDNLIKCGREVVANRGVFIAKKKYILHVVDKEGTRIPYMSKKSIKAMGSEIKKSDTPKVIQKFLKHISMELLNGATYKDLENYINNFRGEFKNEIDILDLGVSKSCNKLALYSAEYEQYEAPGIKKVRLPGHVRAAINYDTCKKIFGDDVSKPITSGNKIKYFYLKKNMYGFTSIAFPSDISHLPQWFLDNFTIDIDKIENKLIDLKVKNLFDALNWSTPTPQSTFNDSIFEY